MPKDTQHTRGRTRTRARSARACQGGQLLPVRLPSSCVWLSPRGQINAAYLEPRGVLDLPGQAPTTQEGQGWSECVWCSSMGKAHTQLTHGPVTLGVSHHSELAFPGGAELCKAPVG